MSGRFVLLGGKYIRVDDILIIEDIANGVALYMSNGTIVNVYPGLKEDGEPYTAKTFFEEIRWEHD